MQLFGGDEAAETAIMAEKFNKFFDCLNISSFRAGKLKRDPFKSPYRSAKDFRLTAGLITSMCSLFYPFLTYQLCVCVRLIHFKSQWLKEDFLGYLAEWEKSVHERKGYWPM